MADLTELFRELHGFLRTLHRAWLLATIPAGIVLLYFGYRFYEALKFILGFIIGGVLIGALLLAVGGPGAGMLGFVVGGVISGLLFRAIINAIPQLIGAMLFMVPTLLILVSTDPDLSMLPGTDIESTIILVSIAGLAGAYVGHLLSTVITVVGTSFLGAVLIVKSVARIHVGLEGSVKRLVTDPSTYLEWVAGYAVVFLCLLLTGIWYQSRWIMRHGTTPTAVRPVPPRQWKKDRDRIHHEHRLDSNQLLSLGILVVVLVERSSATAHDFLKHSLFQVMRRSCGLNADYLEVLETAQGVVRSHGDRDEGALFRMHASTLRGMGRDRLQEISSAFENLEHCMNEHQLALVQLVKEDFGGA